MPELPTRHDVLVMAWEKFESANFSGNVKLMEQAKFLVSFAALLPDDSIPSVTVPNEAIYDMEDDRP